MRGRFTYRRTLAETRELFAASVELDFSPRYNIAPTQQVLAVGQTRVGERKAVLLLWGLILSWTRDTDQDVQRQRLGRRAAEGRFPLAIRTHMIKEVLID